MENAFVDCANLLWSESNPSAIPETAVRRSAKNIRFSLYSTYIYAISNVTQQLIIHVFYYQSIYKLFVSNLQQENNKWPYKILQLCDKYKIEPIE